MEKKQRMKLLFSDGTTVEVKGAKVPESFAEDGSDTFPIPEFIFTYDPRFFKEEVDVSNKEWVKFLDFAHFLHWDEKFFSLIFDWWRYLLSSRRGMVMTDLSWKDTRNSPRWYILNKADTLFETNFLAPLIGEKHYFQEVVNIFKFLRRENFDMRNRSYDDHQFEWETPSLIPFVAHYEKLLSSQSHDTRSHFFNIFSRAFSLTPHGNVEEIPYLVELLRRFLEETQKEKTLSEYYTPPCEDLKILRILMNENFIQRFPELRDEIISRKWVLGVSFTELRDSNTVKNIIQFFEYVRGKSIVFVMYGPNIPEFRIGEKNYTVVLESSNYRRRGVGGYTITDISVSNFFTF